MVEYWVISLGFFDVSISKHICLVAMGLKVWHMVLESAWGPYCRKAVYIYIYINMPMEQYLMQSMLMES